MVQSTASEDILITTNYNSLKNQVEQLTKIKEFTLSKIERRFISILPVETALSEAYKTILSWYKETQELNRIQNI